MGFDLLLRQIKELGVNIQHRKIERRDALPPYAVWYEKEAAARGADFKNFYTRCTFCIDLYTSELDNSLEKRLEGLFFDTPYAKSSGYISDEGLHMSTYEFTLVEKI